MHACMARTIFGIKGTAPSTMAGRRDGRGGVFAGLAAPCGGLPAWYGARLGGSAGGVGVGVVVLVVVVGILDSLFQSVEGRYVQTREVFLGRDRVGRDGGSEIDRRLLEGVGERLQRGRVRLVGLDVRAEAVERDGAGLFRTLRGRDGGDESLILGEVGEAHGVLLFCPCQGVGTGLVSTAVIRSAVGAARPAVRPESAFAASVLSVTVVLRNSMTT